MENGTIKFNILDLKVKASTNFLIYQQFYYLGGSETNGIIRYCVYSCGLYKVQRFFKGLEKIYELGHRRRA